MNNYYKAIPYLSISKDTAWNRETIQGAAAGYHHPAPSLSPWYIPLPSPQPSVWLMADGGMKPGHSPTCVMKQPTRCWNSCRDISSSLSQQSISGCVQLRLSSLPSSALRSTTLLRQSAPSPEAEGPFTHKAQCHSQSESTSEMM